MKADIKSIARKGTQKPSSQADPVELNRDEDLEKAWLSAESDKRDAEARLREAGRKIVKSSVSQWKEECQKLGQFSTVAEKGGIKIIMPSGKNFLKPSTIDEEQLRARFGEDFDSYFRVEESPVRITEEAMENTDIRNKITEFLVKLSKEHPDIKLVEYDTSITPRPRLAQDWVLREDKNVGVKLQQAGAEVLSPTIRPR